jgi:hypothetical protein
MISAYIQEVEAANLIMELPNQYLPFAKIYDITKIKNNLYYILKEKVKPLSEHEQNIMTGVLAGEPLEDLEGKDKEIRDKLED